MMNPETMPPAAGPAPVEPARPTLTEEELQAAAEAARTSRAEECAREVAAAVRAILERHRCRRRLIAQPVPVAAPGGVAVAGWVGREVIEAL